MPAIRRQTRGVLIFIVLFLLSFLSIYHAVVGMDGTRIRHEYKVEIPDDPGNYLVYFEYEPLVNAPDRDDHVCFLFSGFQTPIEMMIPMMRELTRVGYHVVMGDFRGQGRSGGELPIDWRLLINDFDIMYNDVFTRHPEWNSTHVSIVGHSMAGFAVLNFGKNRESVWTTVAVAPASYPENVNHTHPKNLLIINGQYDQAFSLEDTEKLFHQAVPNGEPGILYGDPLKGTAKQYLIMPQGRHETECYSDFVLSHAVTFIEMSYGYLKEGDIYLTFAQERMNYIMLGFIFGAVGFAIMVFWVESLPSLRKGIYKNILTTIREKWEEFARAIENSLNGPSRSSLNLSELFKKKSSHISPERKQAKLEDKGDKGQDLESPRTGITTVHEQSPEVEIFRPLEPEPNPENVHLFGFIYKYFHYIPEGLLISIILFFIALATMKNLYAHLQILFIGQSGFTALFLFKYLYTRQQNWEIVKEKGKLDKEDPRFKPVSWKEVFRAYKTMLKQDCSIWDILKSYIYAGIFMAITIFAFSDIFTYPFPLNSRTYQLFFYIPFVFLCYLFQVPVFLHYLTESYSRAYPGPLKMEINRNPLFKSLVAIFLAKFGAFYAVGIILFFMGSYMITIIFLLTLLDIALTLLLVYNYYHNQTYMSLIIFGALTVSFVYLGFSGVLNGWQALFGNPNIFIWMR